jgi:EAL domain-containing protein (putative c-di-GMP-specific phosphodiesterase class I)
MIDSDDAVIASTIISMAQNLRLTVIAEGVETLEQLAFLRQQGCHEMQGYYFSKPLPAEKFACLLAESTK